MVKVTRYASFLVGLTLLLVWGCDLPSDSVTVDATMYNSSSRELSGAVERDTLDVSFSKYPLGHVYNQNNSLDQENDFGGHNPARFTLEADPLEYYYNYMSSKLPTVGANGLKVIYPKGQVRTGQMNGGPGAGSGYQMFNPLSTGKTQDLDRTLEYNVIFEPGFDVKAKGGKLPGFGGGTVPTGGISRTDGFSARFMWRSSSTSGKVQLYSYLYANGSTETYVDLVYPNGSKVLVAPGEKITMKQRIKMNTGNNSDGILQVWVNGQLVLDNKKVAFSKNLTKQVYVDVFYFSTFFGGGDTSWAPGNDCYISFNNIKVTYTGGSPSIPPSPSSTQLPSRSPPPSPSPTTPPTQSPPPPSEPPVASASDNFETDNLSGGSGWTGVWKILTGDTGTFQTDSEFSIGNAALNLRNGTSGERVVNLAGTSGMKLSFQYLIEKGNYDSGEGFDLYVNDGSDKKVLTWTDANNTANAWKTYTLDLSPYTMSSSFKVKFVNRANSNSEEIFIDNINISR